MLSSIVDMPVKAFIPSHPSDKYPSLTEGSHIGTGTNERAMRPSS